MTDERTRLRMIALFDASPVLYLLRMAIGILLAFVSLSLCAGEAVADGPSAWLNLDYFSTVNYEDGDKASEQDRFTRNLYLRLDKSITPMLSYQLYLRTNWVDTHNTDEAGRDTAAYQRTLEPALDIFLRGGIYDLSAGLRRQERWTTANLKDEGRRTTDFLYTRLNIFPYELPTLSLQFDRQKEFDYLSPSKTDSTNTRYTGISTYQYFYKGLDLSYNLTYNHSVIETPIDIVSETTSDVWSGLYKIAYTKPFWGDRATVTAVYQGNYIRTKTVQTVVSAGSAVVERTPLRGLHATGTLADPDVDLLANKNEFINNDINTASDVNIGNNGLRFHNMGLEILPPLKAVDRIFVYVNKDVSLDTVLSDRNNWKAYRSLTNVSGSVWTEIAIQTVSIFTDTLDSKFRYEIRFFADQTAPFYKVINMQRASMDDVFVTEVEAHGTDVFLGADELEGVNTFFNQEMSLGLNVRPVQKLSLYLSYSLNRTDSEPDSPWGAIGGMFSNIISNSLPEPDDLEQRTNVIRSYNANVTWLTHRYLTTNLRLSRMETFDNQESSDFSSNSYGVSFSSSPLPTLDMNLSLIRTDSFSFGEEDSTNDSVIFSMGAKLYADLNLITDVGFTNSRSHATGVDSKTSFIRGSIDAQLTSRFFATLSYGLNRSSSDGTSSRFQEGGILVTYRPGRYINLSGNLRISSENGNRTLTHGLLVDWLPLRTLRLNLNYLVSRADESPKTRYSLGGYGIWYITKFMDLRLTYAYTVEDDDIETKAHNFGASLNSRFW